VAVLLDLRLNLVELDVREVEPLVRAAEAGIELTELAEDLLCLRPLRLDGARGRKCRDCDEKSRKNPEYYVDRMSASEANDSPRIADGTGAPGGAGASRVGQVSKVSGRLQPGTVRRSGQARVEPRHEEAALRSFSGPAW